MWQRTSKLPTLLRQLLTAGTSNAYYRMTAYFSRHIFRCSFFLTFVWSDSDNCVTQQDTVTVELLLVHCLYLASCLFRLHHC